MPGDVAGVLARRVEISHDEKLIVCIRIEIRRVIPLGILKAVVAYRNLPTVRRGGGWIFERRAKFGRELVVVSPFGRGAWPFPIEIETLHIVRRARASQHDV